MGVHDGPEYAAHGATLPPGAPLAERYSYQFYVKPDDGRLKKLLRELPEDAQAVWEGLSNPKSQIPKPKVQSPEP